MRSSHRWLCLLILSLWFASPATAAINPKQILSSVTGQVSGDGSEVVPLSAREIPAQADTDEQFADEVRQRAATPAATTSLDARISTLASGVSVLARRMRTVDLARVPVMRLESLRRNWKFYDRQLAEWQREADRVLDSYSADAAQLAARRAVWLATRKRAQDAGIAPALLQRVDDVLRRLDAADRALSRPLERQIELGRRGNAVANSIEAGLLAVDAASTSFDFHLALRDSAPLWKAWGDPRYSAGAMSAARGAIGLEREFLRRYLEASRDRLLVHGAFALLVLPALLWLRGRSRKLVAEDPALESSTQALRRPVSAWLVLVLVATLFFQSDSPILLHELALLIAVIPVLRLLPREIFDLLGPWPYAATVLYILQRAGVLFVSQPLWHRMHLLVVTLATLGVLVWIIVYAKRRRGTARARPIERAARLFGLLGVIALAVSAVANLFGNVSLAELLTRGTLDSGYVGLVLFAGASVLGSIIRHLLARRSPAPHALAVAERAAPLLETLARLIRYATAAAWALLTLNEFRILRPIVEWLRRVLTASFGLGEISLTLGNLLLFVAAVYIAFWVARLTRTILRDEVLGRMPLPRGVANSVSTLTYYAMVLVGFFIALAASGFEVGQLAIIIGAVGVGVGLGLQNVVNNFVSGLILMFERPIQPGDVIEITGTTGKVSEIGMRATTLTTADGADVVVPNGTLLSEKLVNWTLRDTSRRVDVDVGVPYGSDPRQILDLLRQVALSAPGIVAYPAPEVFLLRFGPSSLDFGVRAWTDFATSATVRTDLAVRVHDALKGAGIGVPVPQQSLHIQRTPKGPKPESPERTQPGRD